MQMNSLQDLYLHKLRDLYSAEQQITRALPQMIQRTSHAELRQGFETHLRQTEQQLQRLEQLFQTLGERPAGEQCKGMQGIIEEGQKVMQEVEDPNALDAALIAAAQSVEHYEIAGYGTARTWAQQLGRQQDAQILQQTLQEEEQTDKLLTQVAESLVNRDAQRGDREVARGAQPDLASSGRGGTGARRDGGGESRL